MSRVVLCALCALGLSACFETSPPPPPGTGSPQDAPMAGISDPPPSASTPASPTPADGQAVAPGSGPRPEGAGPEAPPPPPQASAADLPNDLDAELLDEEPFRLATTTDTYQLYLGRQGGAWWGRTLGTLDASVSDLSALVSEPAHYGTVFPRFTRFEAIQDGVYHAVLDLPDPMGQRSMVLRRSVEQQGDVATVDFRPAPDVTPPEGSPTFLPDYEVSWRFEPVGDRVRAQVTWNTELAIPLPPSFAKHAVEARAGEEFAQLMAGTQCARCHEK